MITDIVFDFYGTLVGFAQESVRDGERRAYEFLVSKKFEISYDDFRKYMNDTYGELVNDVRAHHREFTLEELTARFMTRAFGVDADTAFTREFGRVHVDEWNEGTRFFDGMTEFIEDLAGKYRLSIISNTHCAEIVWRNLRKMKVENRFHYVATSIEFGLRKPHADIFRHTLEKIGAEPHRAVFVGDTYEDDYLGSKRVGMNSFLIDVEKKRLDLKDERLNHIFELKAKIKNLGPAIALT